MKHFPFILALILSLFGSLVFIASAQNYVPLAPLPGTFTGTEAAPKTDMTTYLSGAIKLLLAIGASLAILMTVIGGTQYVAAGISPDAKSKAKDMITNSFIGLALMLVSYLILNSINPKLVQFDLSLKQKTALVELTTLDVVLDQATRADTLVAPQSVLSTYINDQVRECMGDIDFDITLSTPEARIMEETKGNQVIFYLPGEGVSPTVVANLLKLKAETDKLKTALAKMGASATVTSAYRPREYQKHLWYLQDLWVTRDLKNKTDPPNCLIVKETIRKEYEDHFGPRGTSRVANPDDPNQGAPHLYGRGVDIKLTGIRYEDIQAFMDKEGIGLTWQNIPGDIWHFNLKQGI